MYITENVTVYKCEHCGKKLFRKHAMLAHEKKCSKNPLNIRACFDCTYCERIKIEFELEYSQYSEFRETDGFKCIKKDLFIFPPKLEYSERGVPAYVLHNNEEILQEKMPLICSEQKKEIYDDFMF